MADKPVLGLLALAFLAGFVSMSQEIVWVVLLSYATAGSPASFANVLGFLLFGTAVGSLLGSYFSQQNEDAQWSALSYGGLLASITYVCSVTLLSYLFTFSETFGFLAIYFFVFAIATLWGVTFPLLSAAGVTDERRAGWHVSWIYLANITGAVCGPLVTGFFLLEYWTLNQVVAFLAVGTLLFVVLVLRINKDVSVREGGMRIAQVAIMVLVGGTVLMSDADDFARLQWKESYSPGQTFSKLVQNRHGVIAVEENNAGDILYGGGIYDGRYNVDPVLNSNGIRRTFMLASLHRQPRRVLMIGLGSGSWASVVADHEDVESLEVIEINPGYLELIKDYPAVSGLMTDPKVSITIDDGRRWLRRNPERKYDMIVMNSSFHWRNNMTYLLSEEFFELCRERLNPNGLFYFNTTFSKDVVYTVAEVFPYVTTVEGFAAASMQPFDLSQSERFNNLLKFSRNGKNVLDPARPETREILMQLASMPLPDVRVLLGQETDLLKITDDNMATEYKRERRWYNPEWNWYSLWRRLQE